MEPLSYELQAAPDEIAAWMVEEAGFVAERAGRTRHSYLDTFDWRLYRAGLVLEARREGAEQRLVLRSLGVLRPQIVQPCDAVPRFAHELGDSPLGERIAPLVQMRALLPLGVAGGSVRCFAQRDKRDKVRLRAQVGIERLRAPGERRVRARTRRLELLPVTGYQRAMQRVRAALSHSFGLAPQDEDPLLSALRALAREPGDYSSKLDLALEPEARADAAARRIALALLDALQRNEPGLRADLDSEFLHDFRVAVRRTRALLGQVKQVFPESRLRRFRGEFAWLGRLTGPARDMDVYLLAFDGYRAELPPAMRDDLLPFRDFLHRHKHTEYDAMRRALDGARYRRLLCDWRRLLQGPLPVRPSAKNAIKPIKQLADERIWRVFRRVLREGGAIGDDTPPEALHELRKTCKKLRYLLEFFRGLYPVEEAARLVRALKQLQDNLGDFQDFEVQQTSLTGFAQAMHDEEHVPDATMQAMAVLVEHLAERQAQARAAFAGRFARFASAANRKRFKRLMRAG